jgi:ApeA N-terminal domain 1
MVRDLRSSGQTNLRRRRHDFSNPDTLYLLHQLPRPTSFEMEGARYSIFAGATRTRTGWQSLTLETHPILQITFPEPTAIDMILDRIWSWKRFFSQVALEPVNLEMLYLRPSLRRAGAYASVYLPNVSAEKPDIHPGDIPLNRWNDRRQLNVVMQNWLSRARSRHAFRVLVDHVISAVKRRVSHEDILTLCSAIESLSDLPRTNGASRRTVRRLADAAVQVNVEHALGLDPSRIRGVIGQLSTKA